MRHGGADLTRLGVSLCTGLLCHLCGCIEIAFGLISLGSHYFLQMTSAGLVAVLVPACCWACCSYKRVKFRKGEATLWGNESACTPTNPMQPASHRGSHTRTHSAQTHRTTSTATNSAPYTFPIMTSALALQTQHRNANPAQAR